MTDKAPVVENNVVISKSLDYKVQASSAPKYRLSLLPPQTSLPSTMSATSITESIIELPAGKAFNLSNSFLLFNVAFALPGAAARFNYFPADFNPTIQRIQLYTRGVLI